MFPIDFLDQEYAAMHSCAWIDPCYRCYILLCKEFIVSAHIRHSCFATCMVGLVYNCMWGSDAYPFQLVYFPSDYDCTSSTNEHAYIHICPNWSIHIHGRRFWPSCVWICRHVLGGQSICLHSNQSVSKVFNSFANNLRCVTNIGSNILGYWQALCGELAPIDATNTSCTSIKPQLHGRS